MQHVLIFVKTPYARTPYDQWLKDTGFEAHILVAQEHAAGYGHLPNVFAFADYDRSQKVQEKAYQLASTYKLAAVFARAESDVIRAAQLREAFAIQGQRSGSALAYRNKVVMKDHLRQSGVCLPVYKALESTYDVLSFIREHGYPVVIKPFAESGSTGTQIIEGPADLENFLQSGSFVNMEIEKFVQGQMYHVDGLVRDGEVRFIQASRYVNDCLSYRQDEYNGSVKLSPANPAAAPLEEATRTILAHLPSPQNMAFHCELWRQVDGQIVFCEIASRTGGGLINLIQARTSGFNIDKEWLLAECGLPESGDVRTDLPGGDVLIPARRGKLLKGPTGQMPEGVLEFEFTGTPGQVYHGGIKSGLYLGAFVLTGTDEEDVERKIQQTAVWFNDQLSWES